MWRPTERCRFEGCAGWAWAQGYCDPHYQKLKAPGVIRKRRISNDDLARFHTKYVVNPATGCWDWAGTVQPRGYGMIGVTEDGKGRSYRAHRFAYMKLVGPIPDGAMLLHLCDNRRCVNPRHLIPGTSHDNMRDSVDNGRNSRARGTYNRSITPAKALNIRVLYAKGLV